jgi:hypothetical protein
MMFLPIIANIAVLTCSVGFKGTWLLTIFMCLAAFWLVCWEYDRLKPIVFADRAERARPLRWQFLLVPAFFASGGVAMGVLWWAIRVGNFSNYLNVTIGLVIVGAVFGFVVATHYRFMPVRELNESTRDGLR